MDVVVDDGREDRVHALEHAALAAVTDCSEGQIDVTAGQRLHRGRSNAEGIQNCGGNLYSGGRHPRMIAVQPDRLHRFVEVREDSCGRVGAFLVGQYAGAAQAIVLPHFRAQILHRVFADAVRRFFDR